MDPMWHNLGTATWLGHASEFNSANSNDEFSESRIGQTDLRSHFIAMKQAARTPDRVDGGVRLAKARSSRKDRERIG